MTYGINFREREKREREKKRERGREEGGRKREGTGGVIFKFSPCQSLKNKLHRKSLFWKLRMQSRIPLLGTILSWMNLC